MSAREFCSHCKNPISFNNLFNINIFLVKMIAKNLIDQLLKVKRVRTLKIYSGYYRLIGGLKPKTVEVSHAYEENSFIISQPTSMIINRDFIFMPRLCL